MKATMQQEIIEKNIFLVRGNRVMLSTHLAELYGVEAKVLVHAVKRNIDRFPEDFVFRLTWKEATNLKSQIVTLKRGHNIKYLPYAFTEQGVAMLSSVLNSEKAVQANIAIMRAFVKMREIVSTHKELFYKLSQLERKAEEHDTDIHSIFEAIRQLMAVPKKQNKELASAKPK